MQYSTVVHFCNSEYSNMNFVLEITYVYWKLNYKFVDSASF